LKKGAIEFRTESSLKFFESVYFPIKIKEDEEKEKKNDENTVISSDEESLGSFMIESLKNDNEVVGEMTDEMVKNELISEMNLETNEGKDIKEMNEINNDMNEGEKKESDKGKEKNIQDFIGKNESLDYVVHEEKKEKIFELKFYKRFATLGLV
jgi:hypothetical protein